MADNNPSDVAAFLAHCVAALDYHAKDSGDDTLSVQCRERAVMDFLDAFRLALDSVVPALSLFTRTEPVTHAGVSAASYHELVCRCARRQYDAIWLRVAPNGYFAKFGARKTSEFDGVTGCELSAENVVNGWRAIAGPLLELFAGARIDADYLVAGINTERIRSVEPAANGSGSDTADDPRLRLTGQAVGQTNAETASNGQGGGEPRLIVNLRCKTATLDGVPYDVASEQALRWVKVLVEHPSEWIAGGDLKYFDGALDGARTDKLRPYLPVKITALIESSTGKGSRFNTGATAVTRP